MSIKLMAAKRLALTADWFAEMSAEQKKAYLEEHPDSKYATVRTFSPQEKAEIARVKDEIKTYTEDLADFEEDGDLEGVEKCKRILVKLKAELHDLTT
jgi:hypothetical protein